jgi:hypothetical protein
MRKFKINTGTKVKVWISRQEGCCSVTMILLFIYIDMHVSWTFILVFIPNKKSSFSFHNIIFKLNIRGRFRGPRDYLSCTKKTIQLSTEKKREIINNIERITYSLGLLVLDDSLVGCVGKVNFWSQFRDNVMAAPIFQCHSCSVSCIIVRLQTNEEVYHIDWKNFNTY